MNADNLVSINCNRVNRNQFLDELTAMTAFSARQNIQNIQIRYLSCKFIGMAIYRAKSVPQKSPTSTDLRANEATKIFCVTRVVTDKRTTLSNQSVTWGQRLKVNSTDFVRRAGRYLVLVLRSHKTRLIDRLNSTFFAFAKSRIAFSLTIAHRLSKLRVYFGLFNRRAFFLLCVWTQYSCLLILFVNDMRKEGILNTACD